jgi:hypothetical protein
MKYVIRWEVKNGVLDKSDIHYHKAKDQEEAISFKNKLQEYANFIKVWIKISSYIEK